MSRFEEVRLALRARLADRTRVAAGEDGFRAASVLVPLLASRDELALLFIERQTTLRNHAGQIAFPGGKLDPCDTDAAACAKREAAEELGLRPEAAEVLGLGDDVRVPSGFVITPVVGWIADEPTLTPDPVEVATYFFVPLAALRDPAVYEDRGERRVGTQHQRLHAYHVEGRVIWGATARIVHHLLALMA